MNTQNPLNVFFSLIVFFLLSFSEVLIANENEYPDRWGKQGFSIIKQTSTGVEINYSITAFNFTKVQINGKTMDAIELPGLYLPNDEGAPDLPGTGRLIAIPQGSKVSYNIIKYRTETFTGIDLAPAPVILLQTETGPLKYYFKDSVYTTNKFYPKNPVSTSDPYKIRGVDVIMLGITPFQYNPVTKELIVYRDLKIEIKFQSGNSQFGEDRLRSRWWDPLFEDILLNYESLPEIDYNYTFKIDSKDYGAEYLIISPNGPEFQQWADSIRNFRTLQGILSKVVTLDDIGGNTASLIEDYINDAYNAWDIPPVAVLCLGDYGSDPANSVISPIWNSYCVSDNIYADVYGNDLPDIVLARMCAQNAIQLETMVSKFLNNERNPPTDTNYYNHPITSCLFQSSGLAQICTESLAGFYEVIQNKSTNRINVCNGTLPDEWSIAANAAALINYFGPNGLGYIPATPAEVNCTWNGNTNDVINGINNGAFILVHRGTGSEQGWGEPDFSNSDINALNNTNLTFIWSIDCLTGKYNLAGECFAEKFHRHTSVGNNAGALGIVAASELSYSLVSDIYALGAFDNMWHEFMPDVGTIPESKGVLPAFANVAGKYYLEPYSWPFNPIQKETIYNIFHYFGDAFSTVYYEMPQELDVSHAAWVLAGATVFEVTANEGSLIALSVNGDLIGKADGTGAPVLIQIPPQNPPDEILVTVTKQNYYRYEAWIPVGTGTGLTGNTAQNYINVYPNPVTDNLVIELTKNLCTTHITISNLLSESMYENKIEVGEEKTLNIDMTGYTRGVYFIRIKAAKIDHAKKIIVL